MTDGQMLTLAAIELIGRGTPSADAYRIVLATWGWAKTESLKAAPKLDKVTGQPFATHEEMARVTRMQEEMSQRVRRPIANGGTAEETEPESLS